MYVRTLGAVSLFALCLGLGCSNNSSPASADMTTTVPPDQAVTVIMDLASPPDMTQAGPDMTTNYNGCDTAAYVDASAVGASRTVTFPNAGLTYMPKCLLIAAGQTVTFNGAFGTHPLRKGVSGDANAGSPNNPITLTDAGTTATFTFPTVGTYPYICTVHGPGGMNGVVRVK